MESFRAVLRGVALCPFVVAVMLSSGCGEELADPFVPLLEKHMDVPDGTCPPTHALVFRSTAAV